MVWLFGLVAFTSRAHADDWEAVDGASSDADQGSGRQDKAPPPARAHRPAEQAPKDAPVSDAHLACGEEALPAASGIRAMVGRINDLWGSDIRVYQAVEPEVPHANPGGCIFYNPTVMGQLITGRLDVQDPNDVDPLMWAIFAHEVGHEWHHDFSPTRTNTPSFIKELEADRFSGYTLEKLGIPVTDISPYYSMAGDEFGAGASHGSSAERVAAFKEGWHLAEWKRSENSQSVENAQDESVAPDSSAAAP
jgi:hypothetical protein